MHMARSSPGLVSCVEPERVLLASSQSFSFFPGCEVAESETALQVLQGAIPARKGQADLTV